MTAAQTARVIRAGKQTGSTQMYNTGFASPLMYVCTAVVSDRTKVKENTKLRL